MKFISTTREINFILPEQLCDILWTLWVYTWFLIGWRMMFSHVKNRIFYVFLNTIFLSGQNLYMTLMFIPIKRYNS